MKILLTLAALSLSLVSSVSGYVQSTLPSVVPPSQLAKDRVNSIDHFIVIMLENESFDQLFPDFPGAENLVDWMAGKSKNGIPYFEQADQYGNIYNSIPSPNCTVNGITSPCGLFPARLPNAPYLASLYWPENMTSSFDVTHRYYQEQWQQNGRSMDQYVQWGSSNTVNGIVTPQGTNWAMQYWDLTAQYYGSLAQNFTTFDRFFHSYFGGSTPGAVSVFAGELPYYNGSATGCPTNLVAAFGGGAPNHASMTNDGVLDADCRMINDVTVPGFGNSAVFIPTNQTSMGHVLDNANVTWNWFAQTWDIAVANAPYDSAIQFAYHHHAPLYYKPWGNITSPQSQSKMKDESDFFAYLASGTNLPSVSYVRPSPANDMHPAQNNPVLAQAHLKLYFDAIFNSSYWISNKTAVLITFDENGGYFDHVAPYIGDRDGPGTRIPSHIISPFHANGVYNPPVNSNPYEGLSFLKLLQTRFNLSTSTIDPLRVDTVRDLTNSFAEPVDSGVRGDPQFVGFHGQSFQVHGIPNEIYNLITSASLQVNAKFSFFVEESSIKWHTMKVLRNNRQEEMRRQLFSSSKTRSYPLPATKAWSHQGTYLSQVGIQFDSDNKIFLEAGDYESGFASVIVNGVAIKVGQSFNIRVTGVSGLITVQWSTPSIFIVHHPLLSISFVNSDKFINLEDGQLFSAKASDLDGLLGQTANPQWRVSESLIQRETTIFDYLINGDIFSNDFVSNKFNKQ